MSLIVGVAAAGAGPELSILPKPARISANTLSSFPPLLSALLVVVVALLLLLFAL